MDLDIFGPYPTLDGYSERKVPHGMCQETIQQYKLQGPEQHPAAEKKEKQLNLLL